MAILLTALNEELNTYQLEQLIKDTNLELEQIHEIFQRAQAIVERTGDVMTSEDARTTLERSLEEPDIFTLTGGRAAWIGIEDRTSPGRGFDLRICEAGDGPTIEIWMMNDGDIPGAREGLVPLEPVASYAFAFNEYLHRVEDANA